MNHNGGPVLRSAELIARKINTLSSMWISFLGMMRDGQDPRVFDHTERLAYLELRNVFNWKKNIVVYDIGANTGRFADSVARLRTVSKVYCFEPASEVFEKLVQNSGRTRKIECLQIALGDRMENRSFHINEFNPSSSLLPMQSIALDEFPHAAKTRVTELQIMTLSGIVEQNRLLDPDFIKLDVQGFEDRVIRGGADVFRKARFCMLEMSLTSLYEGSTLAVEMNDLMRGLSFRMVGILDHKVIGKSGEIMQFDAVYENGNYEQRHLSAASM
jgi:FkbM family methyltransferase